MKLKKKPKNGRSREICNAVRCKEEATMEYDPGDAFPEKEGMVSLCDKHAEALEAEMEQKEQAKEDAQGMEALLDLTVRDSMIEEADEAEKSLAMLRELPVNGQADIDFANECLGDVKGRLKRYKDMRTKATKRTRETLDEIRGWFKRPIAFYEQAEAVLKGKIREGMASLQAQQVAQIAAASQAHQTGDMQAVQSLVDAASAAEVHQPDNITMTEHYEFRVDNEDLVPRELCSPDPRKIRAWIAIHKSAAVGAVQGITVWRQDIVGRRGA